MTAASARVNGTNYLGKLTGRRPLRKVWHGESL